MTVAFAIVPVPILLFVALLVLLVGTDHPNGKWADRHNNQPNLPPAVVGATNTGDDLSSRDMEKLDVQEKEEAAKVEVHAVIVPEVNDGKTPDPP